LLYDKNQVVGIFHLYTCIYQVVAEFFLFFFVYDFGGVNFEVLSLYFDIYLKVKIVVF